MANIHNAIQKSLCERAMSSYVQILLTHISHLKVIHWNQPCPVNTCDHPRHAVSSTIFCAVWFTEDTARQNHDMWSAKPLQGVNKAWICSVTILQAWNKMNTFKQCKKPKHPWKEDGIIVFTPRFVRKCTLLWIVPLAQESCLVL